MKTKDLLSEWKSFLVKDLINEVSFKEFQRTYPEFDTSQFNSTIRGNTDYLDIIKNSIEAGQNHGPNDFIQQFDFYKNSIEPNRNNQEFLTVNVPGQEETISLSDKVNPGTCTATYDDIQQFHQARIFVVGKGSKKKLINAYVSILEQASELDFEKIIENNNWVVYYPKTIRGSVALARSYWDGNKLSYDETFNVSAGFGKNVGKMSWCTSVTGSGNMFLNYHRHKNLHMYYCINKKSNGLNDTSRKLCISFSKKNNVVSIVEDHSTVNAENIPISQDQIENILGLQVFSILKRDVESENRQEVDEESYYKSISYEQYLTLRQANENNIEDFVNEFKNMIKYSKDAHKIIKNGFKDPSQKIKNAIIDCNSVSQKTLLDLIDDEDVNIRRYVAKSYNITENEFQILCTDKDAEVRNTVANNRNTPADVLKVLSTDENLEVRKSVAFNRNTPADALKILSTDKDTEIRKDVVNNRNTPADVLKDLSTDENLEVRKAVAYNRNTPADILKILSREKNNSILCNIARNPNTSSDVLRTLSGENNSILMSNIAFNENTPADVLLKLAHVRSTEIRSTVALNRNTTPEILQILANDKFPSVRMKVAFNENTPADVLDALSTDKNINVRTNVARNSNTKIETLKNLVNDEFPLVKSMASLSIEKLSESILRNYIKTLLT